MRDMFYEWLATKLPRRLVYCCAIRLGAYATVGSYSWQEVPALHFIEALQRWEARK